MQLTEQRIREIVREEIHAALEERAASKTAHPYGDSENVINHDTQLVKAVGQGISPVEFQRLLNSSDAIDLNKVTVIELIAEPIKSCNVSTESDSDGHSREI